MEGNTQNLQTTESIPTPTIHRITENKTALTLVRVLLLQKLGNSLQLNVASSLIDSPNLAITEHFLGNAFADEAHAAHPLDGGTSDTTSDLRSIQLGHRGVLDEVLTGFLLPGGVVDQSAGCRDLGVGLC